MKCVTCLLSWLGIQHILALYYNISLFAFTKMKGCSNPLLAFIHRKKIYFFFFEMFTRFTALHLRVGKGDSAYLPTLHPAPLPVQSSPL